jgi:hypothetical protein
MDLYATKHMCEQRRTDNQWVARLEPRIFHSLKKYGASWVSGKGRVHSLGGGAGAGEQAQCAYEDGSDEPDSFHAMMKYQSHR